jgi:hypothetical protein
MGYSRMSIPGPSPSAMPSGGASGKEGMKAGLYFSAAFTVQRRLVSELAYLALAPFLLSPTIDGIVYILVGLFMSLAGAIVLRWNRYPHLHLLRTRHEGLQEMATRPENRIESMRPGVAPP